MSENFFKENIISKEKLRIEIARAFRAAQKMDNYEDKIEELRILRLEKIKGLDSEKEERYQTLRKEIADCELLVKSVVEYKKVLELLPLSKEQINSILNHENAHANIGEQVKTHKIEGFRIRFIKDRNNNIGFMPSVKISTNISAPEKEVLEETILITEAPLNYGDVLSKDDEDQKGLVYTLGGL